MRKRLRAALVGSAIVGAGLVPGLASPSDGAVFIRYVPSVTPSVACVVRDGGTDAIWFGVSNRANRHLVIPIGVENTLSTPGLLQTRQTQINDFIPGSVTRAFVLRVPAGAAATWTVTAPIWDRIDNRLIVDGTRTVSATRTSTTPTCPAGTPAVGTTAQFASTPTRVAFTPVNQRRVDGFLVAASVRFSLSGVRTVCVGPNATALAPNILWGYAPTSARRGGLLIASGGANYAPLPASQVVRTDVFTGLDITDTVTFQRSYNAVRKVVDPQRIWVFGSTIQEQLRNPSPRGFSGAGVIADVTTRCSFGAATHLSRTKLWVDADGREINVHTVTDQPTQSTRDIVVCPFSPPPGPITGCDVPPVGVGPGGIRFR